MVTQPRQTKARTTNAAKAKTVPAAVKETQATTETEKVKAVAEVKTETPAETTVTTADEKTETTSTTEVEDKVVEDPEGLPETDPQDESDVDEGEDKDQSDVEVKDLGNGITLTKPADEGVRNQTLEGFLESKYGLRPEQYSEYLKRTIRGFEQYHANMNKRVPVSLEEAARHQASWFRTVAGALDSTTGDSMICFDVILHLAYRHCDDLFNERLASRAFHLLPQNIRDVFTVYQTIIVNAADARTRHRYIKKNLSLDALGAAIKSDNQRANLLAYLSSQIAD